MGNLSGLTWSYLELVSNSGCLFSVCSTSRGSQIQKECFLSTGIFCILTYRKWDLSDLTQVCLRRLPLRLQQTGLQRRWRMILYFLQQKRCLQKWRAWKNGEVMGGRL